MWLHKDFNPDQKLAGATSESVLPLASHAGPVYPGLHVHILFDQHVPRVLPPHTWLLNVAVGQFPTKNEKVIQTFIKIKIFSKTRIRS